MKYFLHAPGEQPINKHFIHMERHLYDRHIPSCIQKHIITFAEKGYGQIFWSYDDVKELHKHSEIYLDLNNTERILTASKRVINRYWNIVNLILKELKHPIKRCRLAQLYDSYSVAFRNALIHFPATSDKMTYAVEQELRNIIKAKNPEKVDDYFVAITTPTKPDLFFFELNDWIKVAKIPSRVNILRHAIKHSILLPNTFFEKEAIAWAEERLKAKSIDELKNSIKENKNRRIETKTRQKKIFKELNSRKAEQLSGFIREAALLRLQLKACWNGESFHMLPMYKEIARIAGCSVKDLNMYYFHREINNLLHNNCVVSRYLIQARKQCYLLHLDKWQINIYQGRTALEKKKEILNPHLADNGLDIIKGTIANKGRVTGIAKVVKTDNPAVFSEIAKNLTGKEILVTGMTNPAMTMLIEKVKGIITDEGGAACHAAIISREFKIPCLVGCHMATMKIQDKEPILLDANKGFVRKLQ